MVTVQLPFLQEPMTIHNFASENQSQQNYVFKQRLREALAEVPDGRHRQKYDASDILLDKQRSVPSASNDK